MKINVTSEIGKLKKVLVHRPGKEVERIYPEIFERLLFDDIMYLEKAQKEHDKFVSLLEKEGVEVFYIEKLVAEVLDKSDEIRKEFIDTFLKQANIQNDAVFNASLNFLNSFEDNYELVKATIAGITKREIKPLFKETIIDFVEKENDYPIYVDPIPNILFQRDPMISIYNSANINNMWAITRKREALYIKFVYKYHDEFKDIHILQNNNMKGTIEGGDLLVINKNTIFIGLSQRTSAIGIDSIAKKLFEKYSDFKNLIAIQIPKAHATMHLDTVLTQMDSNKFSIDADMASLDYKYFEITREKTIFKKGKIKKILEKYVNKNIHLFVVGNGEPIRAKREQWNDGANCLTIKPRTIVVYDRNKITNKLLSENGINVIKISGSELSRGRGGPRCMAMPLEREDIN